MTALPPRLLTRMTRFISSAFGATSTPQSRLQRDRGLTPAGRQMVEQLDEHRIFVDLAHINPDSFWDAVAAHDPSLPLIATHTGVDGAHRHWRNLDDAQLRAVADTGGVVGIIFERSFLARPGGPRDEGVVLELEHAISVIGEDHVAIGTDYDGAITPPADLAGGETFCLVQHMLDRGWTTTRIEKVLGANYSGVAAAAGASQEP